MRSGEGDILQTELDVETFIDQSGSGSFRMAPKTGRLMAL